MPHKKIRFVFILFVVLNLTTALVYANESEQQKNWESFSNNTLGIGIAATTTSLAYQLDSPTGDAPMLKYKPNLSGQMNLIANYGALSTSIAFGNRSSNEPTEYGFSDGHDYQFRFYGLNWTPEFIYQKYNGYFLDNTAEINVAPNSSSSSRYLRSDLQVKNFNFNLYYNFKPNSYSLASHFGLSKRQILSGGSYFATLNLNNTDVSADAPIVPTQYQAVYGKTGTMTSFNSHSLSIGIAGAYNFVYKNLYMGGLLGLGYSAQQSKVISTTESSHSSTSNNFNSNLKIGLGYNGRKVNIGATLENDSISMKTNTHRNVIDSSIAKISFIYRIEDTHIETLKEINETYF